jgi:hypothetical protein
MITIASLYIFMVMFMIHVAISNIHSSHNPTLTFKRPFFLRQILHNGELLGPCSG